VLDGQLKTAPVSRRKLKSFVRASAAPHRSDGMKDVPGLQPSRVCSHGIPGRTSLRIPFAGLLHEDRPGGAMNGAIHPAPASEGRVGGIDDRIDLLGRDVPLHEFETRIVEMGEHAGIPSTIMSCEA
jgi:hypothetical protein